MKFQNPVVRGFYPDPSVCEANGHYYLVCSSFQYFPGVPLFESDDLVNWKQIGHVLTRPSQVMLDKVRSSGGVFAPTIRFNEGRFYMVTNNNSTNENFYVYTDDIYGEWSDPVVVDQDGIDPSLLFVDGHTYFLSNGLDDEGKGGVIQCEINAETGEKLSASKCIWNGSGGRYLESPHMYYINGYYYLMAAEGGTEYGHMVTYARSQNIWGPFVDYPCNPVLTNRNKAPGIIQAIGHGDLIQNKDGRWYIVTLGFRQIHLWQPFHHLGRETFLTPVAFDENGWFTCGDGTTWEEYEIPGDFTQVRKNLYTFENTDWNLDWIYLRQMNPSNYILGENALTLKGCPLTLEDVDSPTFIALRQIDFDMDLKVDILLTTDSMVVNKNNTVADIQNNEAENTSSIADITAAREKNFAETSSLGAKKNLADIAGRQDAGITVYMCENEHYDLLIRPGKENTMEAVLRLRIGELMVEQASVTLTGSKASLHMKGEAERYHFYVQSGEDEIYLGSAHSKYLSSEVSTGFTGVVLGLFAEGNVTAEFKNFSCTYNS